MHCLRPSNGWCFSVRNPADRGNRGSNDQCRAPHAIRKQREGGDEFGLQRCVEVGPEWPVAASVEFKNLKCKYRPNLPYVLNDVSFKLPEKKKLGICGRTGSGKAV